MNKDEREKGFLSRPILVPWIRKYILQPWMYLVLFASVFVGFWYHMFIENSTYVISLCIFQKLVGFMLFAAHVSVWAQLPALLSSTGVLPAADTMKKQKQVSNYYTFPTLCWISTSDNFLRIKCLAGIISSFFYMIGFLPPINGFISTMIYLSWNLIGSEFFALQFDSLIVELGYSLIFLYPLEIWTSYSLNGYYTKIELFVLWFLVTRLHVGSGAVKVLSNDSSWNDGTALFYHFETQPIPNWTSWYMHHMPRSFLVLSTNGHFIIEIFAALLMSIPPFRIYGFFLLASLQIMIIVTGNFGSFNYFTIICCITWLDDSVYPEFIRNKFNLEVINDTSIIGYFQTLIAFCHLAFAIYISLWLIYRIFCSKENNLSKIIGYWIDKTHIPWLKVPQRNFLIVNNYGVFAVMSTTRLELIVEGMDEKDNTWKEYQFYHKPGNLTTPPSWLLPAHLPRIQWMIWFCQFKQRFWTRALAYTLLHNSKAVLSQVSHNPFTEKPPKSIRMSFYKYTFSSPEEKKTTGKWWNRTFVRQYDSIFGLNADGELVSL